MVSSNENKKKNNGAKIASVLSKGISYLYLIIYSLCIILPFYVLVKTSLTSEVELLSTLKFSWFPKEGISGEAYSVALFSDVFSTYGINILQSFFNTMWQTLPTVIIGLFISGLSAFSFAKLNFPGKNILYVTLLATMMMPTAVLTMPSYIYYNALGWADTVLPIIIPGMFGGAMMVFFLRQFFTGIPNDLLEAAKIDGMGYMGMYMKIMLPLSKPAFMAQFIFAFVGGYNNYLGPLLYLNGKIALYPLQMALTLFRGIYADSEGVIGAFTVLALLPLLIVYIFTQRYYVEGIAATGIKG